MAEFDKSIPVYVISAGKLRRFHGVSVIKQLLWPSLVFNNLLDVFKVIFGFIQSLVRLIIWRPNVIFLKGGYVCLPVGLAARLLGIKVTIHDSDAHPGLTNRIISRFASAIATGAPLENYPYPASKSMYVGIPVGPEFHPFSESERRKAREKWGIAIDRPLIVITGGGLGAKNINDAAAVVMSDLLEIGSVVLVSGDKQYDELRSLTPISNDQFQLHAFIAHDMAKLLGAADLVVSRAGATFIMELASLAKPTILVPNAILTGGHQTKNASVYDKQGAVVVINEDDMVKNPQLLATTIKDVIGDKDKLKSLSHNFSRFARPNAARDVAEMIIAQVK